MKIVTFSSRKGGVGKTTLAVAFAYYLACEKGKRVGFIDLDPQASASAFACSSGVEGYLDAVELGQTSSALFWKLLVGQTASARDFFQSCNNVTNSQGVPGDIWLSVGDISIKALEEYFVASCVAGSSLSSITEQQRRIDESVADVTPKFKAGLVSLGQSAGYDCILIDTEATFGRLAQIACGCADLIVVPSIADRLSLSGLDSLVAELVRTNRRDLLKKISVVFSKFQSGFKQGDVMQSVIDGRAFPRVGANTRVLARPIGDKKSIADLAPFETSKHTFRQKYDNATQTIIEGCEQLHELVS